jgi:4-aminobutyrate aminotransferase/(S)-3-amino-2-methylpropionate transaminase
MSLRRLVRDVARSAGNWVVCPAGERHLDLMTNIASSPLGYRHPCLEAGLRRPFPGGESLEAVLATKPALNMFPVPELDRQLAEVYPRIVPAHFGPDYHLHLDNAGAGAVENVLKMCYRRLAAKVGDDAAGAAPVVSFAGGFHGRLLGSLSLTQSNPRHKAGFPAFPWRVCPWPAAHVAGSPDDGECLAALGEALQQGPAAVVLEPVQCEGGDRWASPGFLRGVRRLCSEADVPLVADEVQTGMSTGALFASDFFQPDAVVFSKKFQSAGAVCRRWLAPAEAYSFNTTWGGSVVDGRLLELVLDVVERDDLLAQSRATGAALLAGVAALPGVRHPRGRGALLAFDVDDAEGLAAALLRNHRLLVGTCGHSPASIRLRPPLTLEMAEVEFAVNAIAAALAAR